MTKTINLYYKKLPNMGDLLNPLIVKEVFGFESKHNTFLTCEMSGIGSGLESFLLADKFTKRAAQKLTAPFLGEVHIWGTGFIRENINESYFYRKNTNFHAVRGELSKAKVERIIGRKLNIPTGDAGLLADRLVKRKLTKKYTVGVIPHFREQDNPIFAKIKNMHPNSLMIDLRDDPVTVVEQIGECDVIISSSLHGLIVADAFGVPNVHIVVTDNLKGDGFKFKDYYSSFGVEYRPINLNNEPIPTVKDVIDRYQITEEMVEKKKRELIASFPFKN